MGFEMKSHGNKKKLTFFSPKRLGFISNTGGSKVPV
jgi:hypothetical protein